MNNSVQQSSLSVLYYHYKNSIYYPISVIALIVVVSVILVIDVIIPQSEQWFSIQNEIAQTKTKINTINGNIRLVGSLDKDKLNKQLSAAADALPPDKNFSAIIGALSNAALDAGVVIEDYSFRVGPLATASAALQDTIQAPYQVPSIAMTITVDGDLNGTQKFISALETILPISALRTVAADTHSTTILLQFFHKPFSKVDYHEEDPLPNIDPQKQQLLDQLQSWQASSSGIVNASSSSSLVSSSAATPVF